MSKSPSQKLSLDAVRTIPLDLLDIHEDNVRKSDADQAGIEDLAADIAARRLLQSLSVRAILDEHGAETGRYGIQAGSRRFRALKLLVKQKKLPKNAPVPRIVKTDGFAETDSLAENTQRQSLKPLDEFRAYKAMADKGHGEDTIRRRLPRLDPRRAPGHAPGQCEPGDHSSLRAGRDHARAADGLLPHR